MATDQIIFTERPYAYCLDGKYIETNCTTCFKPVDPGISCQKCERANYCDEKCFDQDSRWHEFECTAYEKFGDDLQANTPLRMAARLFARLRVDGGIAHLSDNFPEFAKERKYGDLISHADKEKSRKQDKIRADLFRSYFRDTPLKTVSAKRLRVAMCTIDVNSFGVTNDKFDWLGGALYLNTSRFNHSCAPTAVYNFDGNRIMIEPCPGVHPDEYSTELRFDQLTIDYGTPNSVIDGKCFVKLTRQRVESLKQRYFFRCLCSLCVDSKAAELEERASVVECQKCHEPFLIGRGFKFLKPSCKCDSGRKEKITRKMRSTLTALFEFRELFMEKVETNDPVESMRRCELFIRWATPYLHRSMNAALAQVRQRSVLSFCEIPLRFDQGPDVLKFQSETCAALVEFYERDEAHKQVAEQLSSLADSYRTIAEAKLRASNRS